MPDDAPQGRADAASGPASRSPRQWTVDELDPVVRSGYREAITTLAVWLAATVYSVTYCTLNGYKRPAESLTFVLWFPDWVFWGLILPWLVCTLVSIYIALFVIEDDPLASAADLPSEDAPPERSASAPQSQPGGGP
jgi:hypothetical protein